MAYNAKTDWKHDDNITENDVNRWEQGITDAHEKAEEIEEGIADVERDFTAHQVDDAPHQYGNRFEWRYNATTDSLDLVVLE